MANERLLQRLRNRIRGSRPKQHAMPDPRTDLIKQKLSARDVERMVSTSADDRPASHAKPSVAIERLVAVEHGPRLLAHQETPVELRTGVSEDVLAIIHPDVAHDVQIIPYRFNTRDKVLHLAVAVHPTPDRDEAIRTLLRARIGEKVDTAYHIHPDPRAFRTFLNAYYPQRGVDAMMASASDASEFLGTFAPPTPPQSGLAGPDPATLTFLNKLLDFAYANGARDLEILPEMSKTTIRISCEKGFEDVPMPRELPSSSCAYLLRVLKQKCTPAVDALFHGMQKGSFTHRTDSGKLFEVRANFSPIKFGQMVVLRLHQLDMASLDFFDIVKDSFTQRHLLSAISSQRGVIVISSPPSNGKSTLIHAAIRPGILPRGAQVFSIEKPIELINPFIRQQEVTDTDREDLLFSHCLQSAATHVFVGEITRPETADTAFTAATTGLQVFTTTHATSAAHAVQRFIELGVSRDRIASALAALSSTWLLPRVCSECSIPEPIPVERMAEEQFFAWELDDVDARRGAGCTLCNGTGERGVVQLFETLPLTPDIRRLIASGPTDSRLAADLRIEGIRAGMTPLRRSALDLVKQGHIHISRIERFEFLSAEELELIYAARRRNLLNP